TTDPDQHPSPDQQATVDLHALRGCVVAHQVHSSRRSEDGCTEGPLTSRHGRLPATCPASAPSLAPVRVILGCGWMLVIIMLEQYVVGRRGLGCCRQLPGCAAFHAAPVTTHYAQPTTPSAPHSCSQPFDGRQGSVFTRRRQESPEIDEAGPLASSHNQPRALALGGRVMAGDQSRLMRPQWRGSASHPDEVHDGMRAYHPPLRWNGEGWRKGRGW